MPCDLNFPERIAFVIMASIGCPGINLVHGQLSYRSLFQLADRSSCSLFNGTKLSKGQVMNRIIVWYAFGAALLTAGLWRGNSKAADLYSFDFMTDPMLTQDNGVSGTSMADREAWRAGALLDPNYPAPYVSGRGLWSTRQKNDGFLRTSMWFELHGVISWNCSTEIVPVVDS